MKGFELITATARPADYWSGVKALYAAAEAKAVDPDVFDGGISIRPAPWSLELYPTMACNVSCVHCYAQTRNEQYGFAGMSTEMMDRLHASIARMGVRGVQYCGGGEPTLWRGGQVADYIAGLPEQARAGMASNLIKGHVLARADVLQKMTFIEAAVFGYDDATYTEVAGGRGGHTAMTRAVRAILDARDRAGLSTPVVNAKVLINNRNYTWLPRIYDWAVSTGFDNVHLRLVDDYEGIGGFTLDDAQRAAFRELLSTFAKDQGITVWLDQLDLIMGDKGAAGDHRWCWTVAIGLNCWVLANGEVYACGPQWGRPDYLIGTLQEDDLEDIWGGERHRQVAQRLIDSMVASRCFATGCRHIKQTMAIDAWRAGALPTPPADEFAPRHAWFL